MRKCDKKIVLSKDYTPTCMNERNKYMVDNSNLCIASFSGKAGGTKNTIDYAKQKGLKIIIIKP